MSDEKQVKISQAHFGSGFKVLMAVLAVLFLMFVTFAAGAAMGAFAGYSNWGNGYNHMGGLSRWDHMGMGDFGSSKDRARGVVTSVSGNRFTLAGHGSATTVQTDSSTKYDGGNQVKVNDTVIVVGTTKNNVLNADFIDINP